MKKVICLLVPMLLLSAIFAAGEEFWEKKDYKQWSLKECDKLLTDSPWAKGLTLSSVGIMDNSKTSTDGQQPFIKYQVQFRSALPIRQALIRKQQLQIKYDSLPPEKKQEVDKRAEAFLNGVPEDAAIVYVEYSTNDNIRIQELARHWRQLTTELLKTDVYLSASKGDKAAIANFMPPQGAEQSFTFVFPKEVNGKPVVTPQDKNIKLEFAYPVLSGLGTGQAFMEFKVEKMIFGGNIAF